ncbi:MAG TPA: hypothetical protein VHB20_13975 [Verrucomicrobiae bacterium]|jgi:hypothetical protein|nr:hypothetical protein [Verrucomicrobiae bacterium]
MKILPFLLTFLCALAAPAQYITNAPLTRFELFKLQPGVTLVRGMSVAQGQEALFVEVRAETLMDMRTSNSVRAVSLRGRASNYTDVDYIDYDELPGLIHGIQMISQSGHAMSPMDDFETLYRTRSGFGISKMSLGNEIRIIVKSGREDAQRVQIENYVLDELAQALAAAKAKLDALPR